MSNSEKDYPIRGQYGDTRSRCAWCGKPFIKFWRSSRYCSSQCESAGNATQIDVCGICCCSISVIILAVFVVLFAQHMDPIPSEYFWLQVSRNLLQLLALMIISAIVGIYLLLWGEKGHKIRKASQAALNEQNQSLDDALEDIDENKAEWKN